MEIKPIRNESDHDAAMEAVDGLMGSAPNTPDGDALEILATLVEAYEAKHWPMEAPDPVSMIEHVMEARGLRQRDLASLIGSPAPCVGCPQSTTSSDPADDSRPGARMGASGRHAHR